MLIVDCLKFFQNVQRSMKTHSENCCIKYTFFYHSRVVFIFEKKKKNLGINSCRMKTRLIQIAQHLVSVQQVGGSP